MNIETEKDQIIKRVDLIKKLIEYQDIAVKRARRRYNIKRDWITSFWIFNDTSTLDFIYNRELDIKNKMIDYKELLQKKLIKL